MTLEEAINWFINLGYYEDKSGSTFYDYYSYKKAEKIIRNALKNGELIVKGSD